MEDYKDEEVIDVGPVAAGEDIFFIHSRVRHVSTKMARTKAPGRQRFKQYLFGGKVRLVRRRAVKVGESMILAYFEELQAKQKQGILVVTSPDGRLLDLSKFTLGPGRRPVPVPHPRMDSVEYDTPVGIMLPAYADGVPQGDPVAARVAKRLSEAEMEEEEELPETESAPPVEEAPVEVTEPVVEEPVEEASTAPTDPAPAEEAAPADEAVTEVVDPAASRKAEKKKNKRN